MEKKTFGFEIKALEDGIFEGYGSVFGNIDDGGDIVERGAFNRTINNNLKRIKILWQHDIWEPIGKPMQLYEDNNGLYVKAKLCTTTNTGSKCYELMKEGIINELSIGYDKVKADCDTNGIRHLREVKLWEISAVTFAMNEFATVDSVKSFDKMLDEIKEGRMLSSLNQSKIQEAINALMALINNSSNEQEEEIMEDMALCDDNDSVKSTQIIADSHIYDIDSDIFNSILAATRKYL